MYVITETGVVFGRNTTVLQSKPEYKYVMKALRKGDFELATRLAIDNIKYINGIDVNEEDQQYLFEERRSIEPLIHEILIKYIYYFELEELNYQIVLSNLLKNLFHCNSQILETIKDNYFPVTEDGRLVVIINNNLVCKLPKSLYNETDKILEYDIDPSAKRSILYREDWGMKGAL